LAHPFQKAHLKITICLQNLILSPNKGTKNPEKKKKFQSFKSGLKVLLRVLFFFFFQDF
jgi:hypothetical protein